MELTGTVNHRPTAGDLGCDQQKFNPRTDSHNSTKVFRRIHQVIVKSMRQCFWAAPEQPEGCQFAF